MTQITRLESGLTWDFGYKGFVIYLGDYQVSSSERAVDHVYCIYPTFIPWHWAGYLTWYQAGWLTCSIYCVWLSRSCPDHLLVYYTSRWSGHDFACSVRSGRKNCQSAIINRVPELVFLDNVLDKSAAKPSMSVYQLSISVENKVDNVRCQYDDVCNDGEMNVNKYVCMECSV